jgi:hypothetical protein
VDRPVISILPVRKIENMMHKKRVVKKCEENMTGKDEGREDVTKEI